MPEQRSPAAMRIGMVPPGALSRRGVAAAAAANAGRALNDAPAQPGGPTIAFAGPDRTSGVQRLRLDGMAHLRVAASVCGTRVSAILDTGAARTVIDRGLARRLGLAVRPGFNVAGITGDTHGELADDVSVAIGGLALAHLSPGVLDLSRASPSADEPAAIILGRELFQATVADFDFAGDTVVFRDAWAALEPASKSVMALGHTARGTPHIPVSIEGGPEIRAALDIGYNGALLISPEYADAAGLLAGRPLSTVASLGAEGLSINTVATVRDLTLAGVTLTAAPAETPARWNRPTPAIIGLDVIKKFRMLTDYRHGRIGLFADGAALAAPLPKDRSGVGAVPTREGLQVVHVASGSPAERCGLKAGDRIAAVDGEAANLDYVRSHPRMGSGPAGSVFHLRLDDGRSVVLTLADYY